VLAFTYTVCASLRLARYNVTSGKYRGRFDGLPSPAGAGMVISTVWFKGFLESNGIALSVPALLPALGLAGLGVLMVSPIPYHSFKNANAKDSFGAIVFFVILLIAANTMAQAVRERTNELGVLKTLGFTDLAVLLMVMAESVIVALLGGVLGLTLIWLLSPSIYPLVQAFLPVFYVPTSAIVLGLVFAVALGVVSGALPAWTASRLKIVEALRRT
jgi:hypothetical protein